MTNQPIAPTELRRWSDSGLWILCVWGLLGLGVYLIAFDAQRTLERSAPVTPHNAAPPLVSNTAAPSRWTEQQTRRVVEPPGPSLTQSEAPALESSVPVTPAPVLALPPPAASAFQPPIATAPAPVLALLPPAASAFQPPIATAPATVLGSLEVSAPQEAVMMGDSFEIRVGIRGASTARTVQVALEYDATALQILEPEQGKEGKSQATPSSHGEQGRAQATLSSTSSTAAGEEFGLATFRFDVIAPEEKAIFLIATATAYDAAGKAIQILPTMQQEVTVRGTTSSPP